MRFLKLKLEEKPSPSLLMKILAPIVAILMAFAVGAVLIYWAGADPLEGYKSFFYGAFGSIHNISETIVKATPLLVVSLAICVAFRCKVWNIGAEGQLIMGAIIATLIGIGLTGIPAALLILFIFAASFFGGALWGAIPGLLKAKLGVNEIIVTIMMNWIAIWMLLYLVRGPLMDPAAGGFAVSQYITSSAFLPKLIPGTRIHSGFLIALLCAFLVYIFLFKTPLGYRIRTVGANPGAARYGGMSVAKNIVIAMIISGGLAGLAGAIEICGLHHRLLDGISAGYGYIAIVPALLGKLHPAWVIVTSILFGGIMVGTMAMQRTITVMPFNILYVIMGLVILFVLASEVLIRYRIKRG